MTRPNDVRKSWAFAKWDFANRDKMATAYDAVFGKKTAALDAIFKSDGLNWLTALRNILVHKAGVADKKFTELVGGHLQLGKIGDKQQIPLDGKLVASMVDAADTNGVNLIHFVSDWLVTHSA